MPTCEASRPDRERSRGPEVDPALFPANLGGERTERYMVALRDTMKDLASGRVVGRERDDLRPQLRMVGSGRHSIFFEVDNSRVLVIRVLHDRMDYRRCLETDEIPQGE